ncbi:hypothetical protein PRUB_a6003 [Pseudoalteromonas rubra]|uniref:Uncharacterized protein n=1 Tax=Pseudoalteromonas rubra TaxID=43658 RepID=A0A8T0C4F1_9GAMM|nr:hypothetical protein PRUB_a6003 [Pseudoalteromonas rubra]
MFIVVPRVDGIYFKPNCFIYHATIHDYALFRFAHLRNKK